MPKIKMQRAEKQSQSVDKGGIEQFNGREGETAIL